MVLTGLNRKVSIIIITMSIVLIIIFLGLRFSNSSAITGFAVINCEYIIGGIECNGELYQINSQEPCPENTSPICTNICELDRLTSKDDRICPEYCMNYCLPQEIAQEL